MSKKDWIGIIYVSVAVTIWGTVGSLIDYPLLEKSIYKAGSLGQLTTFTITGFCITCIAILLYKGVSHKFTE